jgi:hypothetical protein
MSCPVTGTHLFASHVDSSSLAYAAHLLPSGHSGIHGSHTSPSIGPPVLVGSTVDVPVSLPVGTGSPLLPLLPLLLVDAVPLTSPELAVPLDPSLVALVPAPGSVKQPGSPSSAIVRPSPRCIVVAPSDQTLPPP